MASRLPTNPSLDKLCDEARTLQCATNTPLHQAQFTVARSYGFTGWPALVRYLREAAALSVEHAYQTEAADVLRAHTAGSDSAAESL